MYVCMCKCVHVYVGWQCKGRSMGQYEFTCNGDRKLSKCYYVYIWLGSGNERMVEQTARDVQCVQ